MTAFRCCVCLKRDRFFMLYGVVICLVMYGSELVNSPVGVDDDLFLALPENEVFWCTQGRFVPYLFLKILHQYPFVPGFSLLSSLVASLLAFEIIFFTYDRRLNALKYLTFPIFCGCSTLFHSYSFLCLASVMGWGFLFSAVSWCLLKKRNAVSVVLSVVSGIAALGCYQVFIAFLASLQIFDLLRKNDRTRMRGGELVRRMLFSAVYLAVVYAGYMVCNKVVLRIIGAAPDEYVSGLLTSLPRSAGHLFQILRRLAGNIADIFLGKAVYFTENSIQIAVFTVICILVITLGRVCSDAAARCLDWKKYLVSLILWFPLFLLPFTIPFMTMGEEFPVRTFVTFPFLLTLLLYFSWGYCGNKIRMLLALSAILLGVKFCALNARMSHICRMREQEDARVMDHIRFKLLEQIKQGRTAKIPLVLSGHYVPAYMPGIPYPGYGSQHIGSCAASWRGTTPRRFVAFMQSQMILNFVVSGPEHYRKVQKVLEKMPVYPKAGSMRMVDGIAVVKFGPLLEEQKKYYGVPVQTWGVSGRGEIPAGAAVLWKNSDKNIWFNPQIKVRRSGEKTLLKIKGNNPFFVLHRLPGRDALISIEFTSDWNDTMEIFFKRRDPAGKQLPGFKVEKNFQFGFNRIVFYVPREVMAANRTLRIDPGRGKAGKIELRKITVYAAKAPKTSE